MLTAQQVQRTQTDRMEIFPSELLASLQANETVQVPVDLLSPHPEMVELLSPLPAPQFQALHADIGRNGIQVDLVAVWESDDDGLPQLKLIDGRHRWKSAWQHQLETVPVRLLTLGAERTLPECVLQLNEVRRRMGTNQRALAAAMLKQHYLDHPAARQRAAERHNESARSPSDAEKIDVTTSRDLAGLDFGISGKTVDAGETVRRRLHLELLGAVEDDELTVSQGAELADLLPDAAQDEQLGQLLQGSNGFSTKKSVATFLKQEKRWRDFAADRSGEFVTVDRRSLQGMIDFRARIDQELARSEKLEIWLLEQAELPAGRLVADSRVLSAVKTIKDRLRKVRPYDLCPGCLADQCRGCEICSHSGWLSEAECTAWDKSERSADAAAGSNDDAEVAYERNGSLNNKDG